MIKLFFSYCVFLALIGCEQKNPKQETIAETVDSSTAVAKDSIKKEEPILMSREETEEEESVRVARKKYAEEIIDYNALGMYDGRFYVHTESENVEGQLNLKYLGNKEFEFTLDLVVPDVCDGKIKGTIFMDRTQHGFFRDNGCYLHFNFMGNWGDYGMIVEIEQEENCDKMKGDCIFTGKYVCKVK